MPKVSIGVAIYNSEKFLRECVDSLVNQTLQDIEIILVSDKSPDNSISIMKEYLERYPDKIKIAEHTENKRAGGARNTAIKMATGEFFGYVDADDYVDTSMYEKLYRAAIRSGLDAAECWVCDFDDEIGRKINRQYGGGFTRIVKRQLLIDNDIYYPEKIMYEDNYYDPLLKYYINGSVLVKENLYFERQQSGSVRHTTTLNSLHDRLKAEELIVQEFKRRNIIIDKEFEAEAVEIYCVNTFYLFALTKKLDLDLINYYVKSSHSFLSENFRNCLKNKFLPTRIKPWDKILVWSALYAPWLLWLMTFFSTTILRFARFIKRDILKK